MAKFLLDLLKHRLGTYFLGISSSIQIKVISLLSKVSEAINVQVLE
jgi:hypothetical protein